MNSLLVVTLLKQFDISGQTAWPMCNVLLRNCFKNL